MRYLAKTIELGNITKAADYLAVAQSALGLQIRQLERELGVPLLIRHSRGVSPTDAGQDLYERSLEILALVEEARLHVIASGRKERATVVLGLTNGATALLGRDLLRNASAALPSLQLSLVEEMSVVLIDALERGEVDIALAYDVSERPGLMRVPLFEEEVLFISAAQEADDLSPISFAEALRNQMVLPNERDSIRQQVQAIADRMALPLEIGFEVSSISMLKRLVTEGGVASIMPHASVLADVESGQLISRRIVDPTPKRTLYLVRSLRRARFVQDAELLDYLHDAIQRFRAALGDLVTPLPAILSPLSHTVDQMALEAFSRKD